MAVLRMPPLAPCAHAVLLAFDPPRRVEERNLLSALAELGVTVRRGAGWPMRAWLPSSARCCSPDL
jgi:hypothetical protein